MSVLASVIRLVVEAGIDRRGGVPLRILNGVSLAVQPGEVIGIIGASGSGKSTLGLAFAGYLRPGARIASGSIAFQGRSLLDLPGSALRAMRGRDIAYVPQSPAAAFNPARRIDAQVIEGPILRRQTTRDAACAGARDAYAALGLPDPDRIGCRYPHQLSGGQLQRAAAAMAFAAGPKLVIFDEPTTALDVTTQVGVLQAFRAWIRASGTAALYISHDLAVVAQMAERIVVMERGAIVDDGPAQAVLGRRAVPTALSEVAPRQLDVAPRKPLLALERVRFRYRGAACDAVADVSFEIAAGEVVGLVGESGSGKSTVARLIAGLNRPSAGAMRLHGRPLPDVASQRSREQRRAVQIAFQSADIALNPRQSIGAGLARPLSLFRGLRGDALDAGVAQLLATVDLPPDLAGRYPGQLSGGQKQRVNLARALAAEPDLVICDEVTSALDADLRQTVVALLERLRSERGIAFLFVTHDLSTAAGFADRLLVMRDGRLVEGGATVEVLSQPQEPYTKTLIRSVPSPDPGWLDRILATDGMAAAPDASVQAPGERTATLA